MAGKADTTPNDIAGFGILDQMDKGLPENESIEYQVEDIKDDAFQFRKLTIDPEFKSLIPPLNKGEYEGLKEDIKAHGCRDPLIIWKGQGIILDGHHRYEICEELKLPFETVEYEFADRTGAEIWMIKNQRGRRNLNESQRSMLAVALEALYGEQAKNRQGTRTDLGQKLDQSEKGRSAEKAANEMGISHQTVNSAKKVVNKGIPDLKKMVESGEAKVSVAAKVASYPADVQEKIVEKALNQIQEGKKPKIAAIIREMIPVKEYVQKDDVAKQLEKFKKTQELNLKLLEDIDLTNRPENLAELLALSEKITAKLREIETKTLDLDPQVVINASL
jgi:ParB-like chromosome segregation protein Spo0J